MGDLNFTPRDRTALIMETISMCPTCREALARAEAHESTGGRIKPLYPCKACLGHVNAMLRNHP